MDKEKWFLEFGDKEYGYDFAGRKIKRSDYKKNNSVGWVLDYLHPLELGGLNISGNLKIMHHITSLEKANNYPTFQTLNKTFNVLFDEEHKYYYLEKISSNDEGLF